MRPLVRLQLFEECLTHPSNGNMTHDTTAAKRFGLADAII